jgi:large subunit ribosomal protein L23
MKSHYSIIKGPVVTEKTTAQGAEGNKVVLWVDTKANKREVKVAVEKIFNVSVLNVNTQRLPGKLKRMGRHAGRRPVRKKAYVTLKQGDSIAFYEGV